MCLICLVLNDLGGKKLKEKRIVIEVETYLGFDVVRFEGGARRGQIFDAQRLAAELLQQRRMVVLDVHLWTKMVQH